MRFYRLALLALLLAAFVPGRAVASGESNLVLNGGNSENDDTYSKLYLSSSAYVIKDKDYSPEQPRFGLFTTWFFDPLQDDRFAVRARYCVPTGNIDGEQASLERLELLDDGKVLVALQESNSSLPARREIVQAAYYSEGYRQPVYRYALTKFGLVPVLAGYSSGPPIFHQAVSCASGTSGFDLGGVADALAALPDKTLKVQLHFSNGDVSGWQLGSGTVRELKRLVALRRELAGG
ncbi:hypothetical protein [Gloeobacter kilaueensis]|uniref:Uncharacterized protein n=1 Tax=Gloeobacter kilaueensis (strain ATCC BAA-2537 / CCAP 1431/1 / ULC 316 / JS1) TaxID=1183438 RepID=U5QIG3_GLOK1|nr:hypothetical protein [Gloeobacter kilaueensis]AGY58777.1 hypothetical protein GKIL_2531 [Gloeobacter kilaueensis JS1]